MRLIFSGKQRIQLTSRDIDIFKLIESEGAKTSRDLDQKFWNESSRKTHAGFQRIRKLVESKLLHHGDPKLLYLSDEAKKLLKSSSGVEEESRNA